MRFDDAERRRFLKTAGLVGAIPVGALLGKVPAFGAQETIRAGHARQPSGIVSYDVTAFGAKGDGKSVDSPAINRAIEEAAAAGGGTVFFRAGSYLCYSIHLKSEVALYLDQGATIVAADPATDLAHGYDMAEPKQAWEEYQDYGHNHWHNSLIWGEGLHDVSIFGPGLIWGKGLEPGVGRGADRGESWRREQSDFAQELPERSAAGFFHSARRAFRDSRHGSRQPHHRQSENRHQPRRDGHRLLPKRAGVELQCELALGRRHLPEEFVWAGICAGHGDGDDQQLPAIR